MSNLFATSYSGSTQFSKVYRVLVTVGVALVLIAALLFVFKTTSLAAPIDTTISQRIQNTVLTNNSNVTGTYGEILTATIRFTVTNSTILTGPVLLSAQFPGVAAAPNNQLGFRFLGYQNPIAIVGGTPLTPTGFVSTTRSTTPFTTIITWTFDTITNTSGSPFVYDVPYQIRLAWDGVPDNFVNQTLPGAVVSWSPYTVNDKKTANTLAVTVLKPDLGPTYSTQIARAIPSVQGGATVAYTVTLKNGNNTTGFTTAYDLVVTDSVDSRMAYVSASPAPDIVDGNLLTWNTPNWSLAPNTTWVAHITATLPVSIAANAIYTNTVIPAYTTLPDIAPDEGYLTSTVSAPVGGGIIGTKQVLPTTNVRIGDSVTYTVRMTVSQDVYLATPRFTDTLPQGLHYQPGTFILSGGAVLNGTPITVAVGANELLIWGINDIPANGTSHIFTVNYIAGVTGINANGSLAYSPLPPSGLSPAANSVVATWQDSGGSRLNLAAPLIATTQIAQPVLNNTAFGIGLYSWKSTTPYEVGSTPVYSFSLANTGPVTAYEVSLSFQLPPGVSYQGNLAAPPGIQFLAQPSVGATGALQFIIQEVAKNSGTIIVPFDTLIGNTAMPGNVLSATLSLIDYSSQTDGMGIYDRHYSAIPAAIPPAKGSGFTLKGLTAVKFAVPDPVQPGQLLTYSIFYSNTSAIFTSTNVLITDTYDSLLTYVSSTSSPNVEPPASNPGAHILTWNPGTLAGPSASARITATFQVTTGIAASVRMLTNTITSDSDSVAPAMSRIVTTTLVQAKPTITLDDKNITATAGSQMTYTMIYTNAPGAAGATTGTFTITLDYAPYLTFITSTGRLPLLPNGTLFTDTLGPGKSQTVTLRMQVAQPLPYNLTSFTSTATIAQPSIDVSVSDSENTPVNIPTFTLVKVNASPSGNSPISAGDAINYQIYVTNTGTITGNNIVITDVWDANTNSQNGTGWIIQGTYGVYTIPSLAPNAGVALPQLSMYVTTTLPSNAQVIRNTAQLSSRDTTQQGITYDTPIVGLFIQKTHTPDPAYPGEVLTYTIVYTAYSAAIVSPVVTDTLPPEVTYVSCAGAESCNVNGGKVVWSWPGGLVEGASGNLTLVVVAPATEGITLTNTYASDSLGGATYRVGTPDLTYVGRPHLSISKRATTAVTPIAPGDLIIYTLTYTNSGSYKSTGTLASDTVPANTTFQTCSGASCSESSGLVIWSVGEVPVAASGTLTMVVRVNPDAGTTTIVNNAYSLTADRNVTNEGTPPSISTSIVRPALTVHKSASPSWIALGGTVTYTVQYTNTGGGTFTTLIFTDTIDSRLSIQSASGNCTTLPLKVVSCTDSNLAPGQSDQFTITVGTVSLSNNDVVTNAVTYVAANQTEMLPAALSNIIEVPASNAGAAADFSGSPTTGMSPLNVTFTNLSSGSGINSYLWDFGDGTTSSSSGPSVAHTYNGSGIYTVTLTINTSSGSGSNTRTRTNYITTTGAQTPGVSVTSPQAAKSGRVGQQVIYTMNVQNTGNVPDTFSLDTGVTLWTTTLSVPSVGPLSVGSSITVTVMVTIPSNAANNSQDLATVTATSSVDPTIKSSLVLTTTALQYRIFLPLIRKN